MRLRWFPLLATFAVVTLVSACCRADFGTSPSPGGDSSQPASEKPPCTCRSDTMPELITVPTTLGELKRRCGGGSEDKGDG